MPSAPARPAPATTVLTRAVRARRAAGRSEMFMTGPSRVVCAGHTRSCEHSKRAFDGPAATSVRATDPPRIRHASTTDRPRTGVSRVLWRPVTGTRGRRPGSGELDKGGRPVRLPPSRLMDALDQVFRRKAHLLKKG